LVTAVNLCGARRNFSLCKFTHSITQGVNVIPQLEIESGQVHLVSLKMVKPSSDVVLASW
jgi:hypothetical protein